MRCGVCAQVGGAGDAMWRNLQGPPSVSGEVRDAVNPSWMPVRAVGPEAAVCVCVCVCLCVSVCVCVRVDGCPCG